MSIIGQSAIPVVSDYRQIGGIPSVSINQNAKNSVKAKTMAALPPYVATGALENKMLTAVANGPFPLVDGVVISQFDRILLDQMGSASNVDNGVYILFQPGSISSKWVLTRATDSDQNYEFGTGFNVFITSGTVAGNLYMLLTNPFSLDVTPGTFTLVSSPGGGGGETWAQTLGFGNVSGGTNAVMTAGDAITGQDLALGTSLTLRGGNSSGAGNNGADINLFGGAPGAGGETGSIILNSVTQAFTELNMPSGAAPNTTSLFKVTGITGPPTSAPTGGQLVYDEMTGILYYWDNIVGAWRVLGVSNAPTAESFSVAGGANTNPSGAVATTFVTTTGAGTATGTLANGTVIGQIKNIVMSAGHTSNYALTITASVLDAAGALFGTITYTTGGQGSSLIWDGTNWVILNTGGVLS